MRALIRGNEVMTEPFSPWVRNNLAFLAGTEVDSEGNPMKGDGWVLVEDYVVTEDVNTDKPTEAPRAPAEAPKEVEPSQDTPEPEKETETVTYGGRTYTLDELKKLLE